MNNKEFGKFLSALRYATSEKGSTVLSMRQLGELSYADIAKRLDIPVGTVRSRLYRARDAIATISGKPVVRDRVHRAAATS